MRRATGKLIALRGLWPAGFLTGEEEVCEEEKRRASEK